MTIKGAKLVRASFRLLLLSAIVGLVGLVALSHLLPLVNRELYVVRSGSMTPALPVGSVVFVRHTAAADVLVGDVITFRGENDTVITHRVVAQPTDTTAAFQTKGDASDAVDPFTVPAERIIGEAELVVPVAGAVLLMLGTTVGVIATVALLGGLMVAIWFMDKLLAPVSAPARRRATLVEAN
jgi:signal peptidase